MRVETGAMRLLLFGMLLSNIQGQWINYPDGACPRTSMENRISPQRARARPTASRIFRAYGSCKPSVKATPTFPVVRPFPMSSSTSRRGLKEGLPYQTWAAELVKTRRTEQRVNDPMSRLPRSGRFVCTLGTGRRKVVQTPGLLIS